MDQTRAGSSVEAREAAEPASALTRGLLWGAAAAFLGAGLLLWAREGGKLFTDGLIAAILACF